MTETHADGQRREALDRIARTDAAISAAYAAMNGTDDTDEENPS